MDYVMLGKIMADARKAKDYTQQFVSGMIGVTPANISSWERGKSRMDIDRYIQLCCLYDLDYLATLRMCAHDLRLPHFPVYDEELDISARTITVDDTEHHLISDYRSLNTDGKTYIRQTMAMAVQTFSEKNNATSDMEAAE